jgi:hypothetical protein
MSDIYLVKEKLHKMRAKLYPSYLPGTEGKYIARTINEAIVTIEDICASMKNRGGFDGSYEEAVKTLRHFIMEMLYQLADGFTVNLGFCTVYPNISGTFANEKEPYNSKNHAIDFRFHALKQLRDIRDDIEVIIEGIADTKGYIVDYTDVMTGAVNETFSQMNEFVITGYRMKVAGDDPSIGLYFQNTATNAMTKAHSLAENSQSKLIGIFPGIPDGVYKIVIKTQFAGSGKFLKDVRVIESGFTLKK